VQSTDSPYSFTTHCTIHFFTSAKMSVSQLADPFVEAFSALSVNGPPPDELFVYNPLHSVHQQASSITIQTASTFSTPFSLQQLRLEQLTESSHKIELRLNTASIRTIVHNRRKFIRDVGHMLDSIPHLTELNVTVISTINPRMTTTYNTITDLFWTTINANLFCNRHSLIKYTASMDGTTYIGTTGEEVRALLEDLTFMVI
jgi:hypothetical protein